MIPGLPRDPMNPEDVDPQKGANHDYDSARYFLHTKFRTLMNKLKQQAILMYSHEFFEQFNRGKRETQWINLLS
jgi:hypothetical protein